mmetsp:Transcript_27206/g.79644  ORF Transcript_27206/g.79644 Transcript_27206/m.79644 type:complete len:235 (+) Transcript_27206:120-824(+)
MPPAAAERFPEAAFCVVARQLSLQGGHEGAGGMQAACPPSVFETLRQDLGVTRELFASPLNCAFPRFCSASADVDADFGSAGSFFLYTPRPGAYLANPPFDPAVVAAMAVRMEALLEASDLAGERLTFVCVVPAWTKPRGPHLPAWQQLAGSPHTTCALTLPRAQHAYVDGEQQLRGKGHACGRSRHDTSLLVLQSAAAAREVPFTEPMQARLRRAFSLANTGEHPLQKTANGC